MTKTSYDVIGDIHGQVFELISLLEKLSYKKTDGVWQHSNRKVIFLGDFIDGGEFQKEVINVVRPMIDSGHAFSVMGNHEYNAIAFYTPDNSGGYLRPHSKENINQHNKFLSYYVNNTSEYKGAIQWFKTLPLWIELDELRIVHACWDEDSIALVKGLQNGSNLLSDNLLHSSSQKHSKEYNALEVLLKGKEEDIPEDKFFEDNYGKIRTRIRVKWWADYAHNEKPVFFGHYWMKGAISAQSNNTACLDYSVARQGGNLVSYRWDGEQYLDNKKFVSVKRITRS